MLTGQPSPAPADASNLFTFLGMRLQQSFGNLNCQNFGLTDPVANLQMNGDQVVGVTFAGNGGGNNPGGQCPPNQAPSATATPSAQAPVQPSANPTACASNPQPTGKSPTPALGNGGKRRGGRPPH